MKKLPPNTIFSIKRAADLLEIEPYDLLLMGATGSIYLGVIICNATTVLAHNITGAIEHDIMDCSLGMGDKNSEFSCFDPFLYEEQERHTSGMRFNSGIANGLWHLNRESVMNIAQFGRGVLGQFLQASYSKVELDIDGYADTLMLGRANSFKLPEDFFSDFEEEKNIIKKQTKTVITQDDLFISRAWVEHISDHMEKNLPIGVKNFLNVEDKTPIATQNLNHGNARRFSMNRENCLMALIFTKRNYPDECKNSSGVETNDAWANATRDHWLSVGAGYDEPSVDFLKKIISDMDRRPEDRTTAGKPKGTDTKK